MAINNNDIANPSLFRNTPQSAPAARVNTPPAKVTPAPELATLRKRLSDMGIVAEDGSVNVDAFYESSKKERRGLQAALTEDNLLPGRIGNNSSGKALLSHSVIIATYPEMAGIHLIESAFPNANPTPQDIMKMQADLNRLGYTSGAVDGAMGRKTAKGIGDFLRDYPAEAARVNGELVKTLERYLPKEQMEATFRDNPHYRTASPAAPEATPFSLGGIAAAKPAAIDPELAKVLGAYEHGEKEIKFLQAHLKKQGYDVGEVDGDFGPRSQKAFVTYLEEHPEVHKAMGPNLTLETEIYAAKNGVSNALRQSLNLRDLAALPDPDNDTRFRAYQQYFADQGKPVDLAYGIKAASELTGVPMQNLFAVMKQESINFGDYKPVKPGARGYSSANGLANNYGQFIDGTKDYMDETYGKQAHNDLARAGIRFGEGTDWRTNPLVAPYMVARYLQESGSSTDLARQYPAHVLPVMKEKGDSEAIVARELPREARANKHIFYEGKRAVSYREARENIVRTLEDDLGVERDVVLAAQRRHLKDGLADRGAGFDKPVIYDSIGKPDTLAMDLSVSQKSLEPSAVPGGNGNIVFEKPADRLHGSLASAAANLNINASFAQSAAVPAEFDALTQENSLRRQAQAGFNPSMTV